MRHICYCLCVLFFALSLPCSARLHRLNRALVASPPDPILTPPSHDSFYQVPTDISSYEAGQILRSRPISTSAFKTIYARSATQYFYRTTGNGDEADGTVVTVVSPVVPRVSRGGSSDGVSSRHSILVVGTAEDSAALDCAPSYVYSSVDKSSNSALIDIFNRPVISAALFRGWYVVVPDGEGSKVSLIATRAEHDFATLINFHCFLFTQSAFLSRLVQGRALLDGVRASQSALSFLRDANVAIVGYSGGANAAGAAAELWHNYAPEINVVGVSIGGIPADLNATTYRLDGGRFAGLAFAGAAGLGNVHADFDAFLDANLSEEGKRNFTRLRDGE